MADLLLGLSVAIPGGPRTSGILKYVGPIRGKVGTFGGIELLGPIAASRGKNSGDVEGVKYFDVAVPMTGLFLPWDRLRVINPTLPPVERLKSRVSSSKRDSVHTPTPLSRLTSRNEVFEGNSLRRTTLNYQNLNQSLPLAKRSGFVSGSPSRAPSSGWRSGPETRITSGGASSHALSDVSRELASKTAELEEKESILLELQATVNQLTPILEEYERTMEDKEQKIKKQKHEFDRAREEWRQSLELMLSSQQEAESLYEMQIGDLKDEIQKLALRCASQQNDKHLDSPSQADKFVLLQAELASVLTENLDLKSQIETLSAQKLSVIESNRAAVDKELVAECKKKIHSLTQDVSSLEYMLQETQGGSRAKDAKIAELEIQLESIGEQQVESLLAQLQGVSVVDWESKELELKLTISTLEDELEKLQAASSASAAAGKDRVRNLESKLLELSKELTQLQEIEQQLRNDILKMTESLLQSQSMPQAQEAGNPDTVLQARIEELEHELHMRPSYDELTELQTALEEVDTLHKKEREVREREVATLQAEKREMARSIEALQREVEQAKLSQVIHDDVPATNGALPIYVPQSKPDPSAGRNDWCGLCERDGHDSLHCPYENDIF